MGRPRDKVWTHVTALDNGGWECNYCKREYKGAATRVRNHLSGQGNDISACEELPPEVIAEFRGDRSNELQSKAKKLKTNRRSVRGQEAMDTRMGGGAGPSDINVLNQTMAPRQDPYPTIPEWSSDEHVAYSFLQLVMCAKNVLNQTTAAPIVEPAVLSTDAQPGVQNNPVVAAPNSNLNGDKIFAELRSLLSLSNSVGVREDGNAATAIMINEGRVEEAMISKYPKNTYRFGDGELAPAPIDSSVALSIGNYLISKSAPTGWEESTREEPAVSSRDAADGRSAELRRIADANDSSLGIPPQPPTTATTDNIVHGVINPRAKLAPTLPRINEEAIDSPDQPDHNPIDATPEDMEEGDMSGRAFPQPGQYEEPAVTSRTPHHSTRISIQDSKRVRVSSSVSSANIDASCNVPLSFATWSSGHEHVEDVFVKLQMCMNNVSSMPSDFALDPLFREFVESVGKHGVPSSLLGVDSSDALQESVLRIKHEVDRNMLMLKESWKTTGCTMMAFDLNKHYKKGESPLREDKIVIAIYCPKGIIFLEATAGEDDTEALRRHSPSLYTSELVHWLRHHPYDHDNYKICELNYIHQDYYWDGDEVNHICLRSDIQNLCSRSLLDSEWARNLVDVAVRIHEHLCFLGDPWYYSSISSEKDFSLDVSLFQKEASRLPIFLLIIRHHPERSPGHRRMKQPDIEGITKGSDFWIDGQQLALILNCVLKFEDVMDTLVPTSGYFDIALDKVKNIIESHRLQLGEDALQFWKNVEDKIEDIANTKIFVEGSCSRLACSYLNPVYFVQQLQKEKDPLLPADKLKEALEVYALVEDGADQDEINEEVESYGQVFSKLSKSIQLERLHPVKLWEEHGSDLPVLRRFALELLTRPLSCVCKQVKEHLYQLQGADDYITTLNFRMMRHFQDLGDDIYKPLDLSQLDDENIKHHSENIKMLHEIYSYKRENIGHHFDIEKMLELEKATLYEVDSYPRDNSEQSG